jgi:tRNA (guanine37-N1)-methyltransferase
MAAPEVLTSGNHAQVEEWRFREALEKTRARRPELLEGRDLQEIRAVFSDAMKRAARSKETQNG